MGQKEFTDYVTAQLLKYYPKFAGNFVNKPNDVIDLELSSPSKNLELWLTTDNIEITIGFTGSEKLKDWHMHITTYDYAFIDDDITEAINIIERIITDNETIIVSNLNGYAPGKIDRFLKRSKPEEKLEVRYWSQL